MGYGESMNMGGRDNTYKGRCSYTCASFYLFD